MTPLSDIWNFADREELETLCIAARVNPMLASLPWNQICDDARAKLEKADREKL